MNWKAPFIVYRLDSSGKLQEVFHAKDIQQAKYWLSYIAEIGDVLTKTPAHPKNTSGKPEYWSHKEEAGSSTTSKERWLQMLSLEDFESIAPSEQLTESIDN